MNKTILNFAGIMAGAALLWSCSSEPEAIDCESSNLSITVTNTTNPSCNQSNGSITVSASGGSGEYTYSIDGTNFSESNSFNNLAAGTYTLSVRDNDMCVATIQRSLNNDVGITLSTSIDQAGCGTSNGSIVINVAGGEAPYTYRLNQNSFQSNNSFSNLGRGNYTVTVRDNQGCESSSSVLLTSGLSLENDIKPILQSNCALSGCHVGDGLPDFRQSAMIIANAGTIKTNTSTKIMPPPESGGSLTNDQIQRIACWVDDGAPNN